MQMEKMYATQFLKMGLGLMDISYKMEIFRSREGKPF